MRFAQDELSRCGGGRALDLGCGAGRNAVPLARMGWDVVGIDLSRPMRDAGGAAARSDRARGSRRRAREFAPGLWRGEDADPALAIA